MEVFKNRPEILNLLQSVALEEGFDSYEIINAGTNDKGAGMLSQIYMVTIRNKETDRVLNVAVKTSFNDENSQTLVSLSKCGENEVYFYSKVYPVYIDFLKRKGIENIEFVPKCYKTYLDNRHQILCLENLNMKDYEIIDKTQVVDHDHFSLILETYGKFHAISFALKDQEPEKFEELSKGLLNVYHVYIDEEATGLIYHLKEISRLAYNCLIPGEDDEVIKKFEKYLDKEKSVEGFRNGSTQKGNFFGIIHGDCWSNNMMFKYKTINNRKEVCEMRLLDLQFAKLGSPVCDLAYCLYSGGCKETFDRLNEYLKVYYESFSNFLGKLGSDPKKLFPYEVIEEHWKQYGLFSLFISLLNLKMKTTEKEEMKDRTDGIANEEIIEAFIHSKFDEKVFQERVRAILQHMSKMEAL